MNNFTKYFQKILQKKVLLIVKPAENSITILPAMQVFSYRLL
jgi:hypothetical protein